MDKVSLEFMSWLADTINSQAGQSVIEEDVGEGLTVRELLVRLASKHPQFQKSVFDVRSLSLSAGVAIFYNGRQIELEKGLETKLSDGDQLVFAPVIAGG